MSDKTRLEEEIEKAEIKRRLSGTKSLVLLLILALLASGVYIYKLRGEIKQRDDEIVRIKEDFKREKAELLRRLRESSESPSSTHHSYHPSSP